MEIILKKTVGWSLSGFDLTFHDPIFFSDNFSLKSVDLVIKVGFWCCLFLLLFLVIEFDLSEMIKVVFDMFIRILAFFLIFKFFPFIFFVFGLLISKLLFELFKFLLIELICITLEIFIIFIQLLSVKANVFL